MKYTNLSRRFDVSILCLLPLAAVYIISVFFLRVAPPNGADFLTPLLWRLGGRTALVIFALCVLLVALFLLSKLRKVGFRFSVLVGVVSEGVLFACAMLLFLFLFTRCTGLAMSLSKAAGIVAVSAGAGLWEELLFRALIFWGLYRTVADKKRRHLLKILGFILALTVSSALFSVVHFFAEPPSWKAFWYRFAAGGFLSVLYTVRGLAVCGFSHFFFDIFVLTAS